MDITLAPHIIQAIQDEAVRLGISAEELVRIELGHRFGAVTRLMPVYPGGFSAGPVPSSAPSTLTLDANMIRQVQAMAAAMGHLKCFECTQPLSIAEVREGFCNHCGAALPA